MTKTKEKNQWFQSDLGEIESALSEIGGGNFFKPVEGKNVVRVLPPYSNKSGKFFFEATLHYGFKKDGKSVGIPYTGENSFIMKKLNELASEGEEGAKLAGRFGPRKKYYVNIIDRSTGAVKIWGFSRKILKDLLAVYLDKEDGGAFDHPKDGRDLIIERTGKGMQTRYSVRVRPRSTPAIEPGEDIPDLFDLEKETVREYDAVELKAIWNETFAGELNRAKQESEDDDDDDEDGDDEKPAKSSKVVVEDADEDEEDEPVVVKKSKKVVVEEEDEEEEILVPKKSKKVVVEEDEEEDEEDEPVVIKKTKKVVVEDDEEEPVVIKKKKRVVEEEEEDEPVVKTTKKVRR